MVGKPPPSPPGVARKRDLTELRIANLLRELEAETNASAEAAILYEVGVLYEHVQGQPDLAAAQYEQAGAADPIFWPALMARLRLAERGGDTKATLGARESQLSGAQRGPLRASALVDLALHSEDRIALLQEAIEESSPPTVAGLLLEWQARATGDNAALKVALHAQARDADDDELRAALWLDIALAELEEGEIDAVLEALDHAAESDAVRWQALNLSVRVAREHRRVDAFERAVRALSGMLEAAPSDSMSDPLILPVSHDRRSHTSALLHREAAGQRLQSAKGSEGADDLLAAALRLRPDDVGLRLNVLSIAETTGDPDRIENTSIWFRESAPEHPGYIAHVIRRALANADLEESVATLREITARHPESEYAKAALDTLRIKSGHHLDRVAALRFEAANEQGEDHARVLWHAAQVAGRESDASEDAQSLYTEAASSATGSGEAIIREAMGAALLSQRFDLARDWCDALLARDVEPDERATTGFFQYDLLRRALNDDEEADAFLRSALANPVHQSWAPSVARAHGAWTRDSDLLIQAHETLASNTSNEVRVGHLCALAQAYGHAQKWESAEDALRRALEEAPDDEHVRSLLQSVLRESGRPEAAVSLERERSASDPTARMNQLSLLLAGATAERNGDLPTARHAYEVALEEDPSSVSAALALLDIARRQDDTPAMIRAYSALTQNEIEGGVSEQFATLLGDALRASGRQAEAATAYEAALDHPATRAAGAVGLLSMPARTTTDGQRAAAESVLEMPGPARDSSLGGFVSAYGDWRTDQERSTPGGEAWLSLSELAPDEQTRSRSLLQGLRATRVALGADAADELFLLAQEAGGLASDELEAAVAIDEALSPGDDAEFRADALTHRLRHAGEVGRAALGAAYCRALVDADRGAEAVALLIRETDDRPDDLGLWETLRVAARQAGDWPLVAMACERLARFVDGSLSADLLEEAGVVRLERLDQDQQAEDLFREALSADPNRDVAFRRLHDLLTAKEDANALQELVATRLERGTSGDREELLYERARLLRGFSERTEALGVLDELLSFSPVHAGALALAAEVHVSLEQWDDAVGSLRRLASAEIPNEQKRVAHLGAADFLEGRLAKPEEALAELRAVDALELADASTLCRIGAIETRLSREDDAVVAFQRSLSSEPTHHDAITGLVTLLDDPERDEAIARYEAAVWASVDGGNLDFSLLQGVAAAANWRGHPVRAAAANTTMSVLGLPVDDRVDGPPAFDHVPLGALTDGAIDETLEHIVLRAGPSLVRGRIRARHKADPADPVHAQLDALCHRFDSRLGTVWLAEGSARPSAQLGRRGTVDWLVSGQSELEATDLFYAARLAWAVPRGAGALIDGPPDDIASQLAGILVASRCELQPDTTIRAADLKLPRAIRRTVQELASTTKIRPPALLDFAAQLQRSSDRAGLITVADIGVALGGVLSCRELDLERVKTSPRATNLLRFWLDAESALWRPHG